MTRSLRRKKGRKVGFRPIFRFFPVLFPVFHQISDILVKHGHGGLQCHRLYAVGFRLVEPVLFEVGVLLLDDVSFLVLLLELVALLVFFLQFLLLGVYGHAYGFALRVLVFQAFASQRAGMAFLDVEAVLYAAVSGEVSCSVP